MRRALVLSLIVIIAIPAFTGCGRAKTYADYSQILALQQGDSRWGDYVAESLSTATLARNGCGLLSVMNGVRFLTGKEIDIKDFADFMAEDKAFTDDGGTWRWIAYKQGGTVEKYFTEHPEFSFKFTKYWSDSDAHASVMDEYLDSGSVCVIHIAGHFMCVAAHDRESQMYFLLDSAANPVRETSQAGTWMNKTVFERGYCCAMDGFCAFTSVNEPVKHELPPADYYLRKTVLTVETYGKGSACFADTDSTVRAGTVGDEVIIKVRPDFGHKVSGIIVGNKSYRILNNGKKATYVITQPDNDSVIYVSFLN